MESAVQVIEASKFYYIVGALIVTNLGTIGTIAWFIIKGVWFFAKLDSRVTENTKDINNQGKSIRNIYERLREGSL